MEASKNSQIKVGAFLSMGLIVILGSIFFLGADRAWFTSYIRIHAHFEQTQGLAVGSVVSLMGVTVGNVESIDFISEKNALDVTMKIDREFQDRLRLGSEVEIRTQGALGDKYVFINPGEVNADMLQDGSQIDVARASDLIGIISERGSETNKVFEIINDLHHITKEFSSQNRVSKIINNMESASLNLNQASKEAQKLISQINSQDTGNKMAKSISKLDSILTKIENGEGSLGALINDPSLHNQLKTLLGAPSRNSSVKALLRTSIEKDKK
jgi:phospholipid/cholesterol/gamma-HCH transport system substrate-binding protein